MWVAARLPPGPECDPLRGRAPEAERPSGARGAGVDTLPGVETVAATGDEGRESRVAPRAHLQDARDALDPAGGTLAAWRDLAVGAGNAFLTPEWFAAWSRYDDSAAEARVVVVRDPDAAGEVIGVLPLSVRGSGAFPRRFARPGAIPRRFARPVAIPRRFARPAEIRIAGDHLADHVGMLAAPGRDVDAARAAGAAVAAAYPGGHLRLIRIDRDAPWLDAFLSAWPARMARSPLRHDVLPHLPLTTTWDEFLAGRSRNFRNQVGRKERNLTGRHGATFRRVDDPAAVPEEMARFFALHEGRWGGPDGAEARSSLLDPAVQRFHTDFAAAALEQGWLRLWFLTADGRDVAAIHGWTIGGRACYFNAGWDPAWSEASVGLVLLAHVVREAFAEGAHDYDFLLGVESYKYRFATEERHVDHLLVARPLSRTHLTHRVDQGVRRAGRLLPAERKAQLTAGLAPVARRLGRGG